MTNEENEIREMVDRETRGWDTKDAELLTTLFHPDMVWPWPRTFRSHDPIDWIFVLGRFDRERWKKNWQDLFDTHDLIHNRRITVKIVVSQEGDGSSFPYWSHSGRELFYQTSTALFSAPILDIQNLRLGTPQRLFTLPKGVAFSLGGRQNVSPDDQRFLMLEPAQPSSQLNLVQNWFEELKRLVPTK